MIKKFLQRNRRGLWAAAFSILLIVFAFAGITALKNERSETASASDDTSHSCYMNFVISDFNGTAISSTDGWSSEIYIKTSQSGSVVASKTQTAGNAEFKTSTSDASGSSVKLNGFYTYSGTVSNSITLYVYAKFYNASYGTLTWGSESSYKATTFVEVTASGTNYGNLYAVTNSTKTYLELTEANGAVFTANKITASAGTVSTSLTYGTAGRVCSISASGGAGSYTYTVSDSSLKSYFVFSGSTLYASNKIPAGTYTVPVTVSDGSLSTTVKVSVTINKATLSGITLRAGTDDDPLPQIITYGESYNLADYLVEGCPDEVKSSVEFYAVDDDSVTTKITNSNELSIPGAGVYIYIPETDNYEEYNNTKDTTLTEAQHVFLVVAPEVTVSDYTYGDTLTPSVSGTDNSGNAIDYSDYTITYYYSKTNSSSGGTQWTSGTTLNAGTYYMYAVITSTNGSSATTDAAEFTVSKASVTPTITATDYTYGSPKSPSVSVGEDSATYYYNTSNSNSGGTEWDTSKTLNAGTYYVYAVIAETDNYSGATTATAKLTVSKKSVTPKISVSGGTSYTKDGESYVVYTYTGSAIAPSVTVKDGDGNVIPSSQYDVTYSDNTKCGVATITVTMKSTSNYSGTGSGTFYIDAYAKCYGTGSSSKQPNALYSSTIKLKGIYRYIPDSTISDTHTSGDWDFSFKFYKTAAQYLGGSSANHTITYMAWSSGYNYWSVTDTHTFSTSAVTYVGYDYDYMYASFVVATFTFKAGTSEEVVEEWQGYIYYAEMYTGSGDNKSYYYYAVEDFSSRTVGKTIGKGYTTGMSVTPALSFTVGDVSSAVTYGTAAEVCDLGIDLLEDDGAKYTYSLSCSTLDICTDIYTEGGDIWLAADGGITLSGNGSDSKNNSSAYKLMTTSSTPAGSHTVTVTLTKTDSSGKEYTVTQDVTITINKLAVTTPTDDGVEDKVLSIGTSSASGGTVTAESVAAEILDSEGEGFVVWDWTGFDYIDGEYVSTDSSKKPTATLYVYAGGEVKEETLTVASTGSGTGYTASCSNSNYDLSGVSGVNINNSAYTPDKTTVEGIANTAATDISNTYISGTAAQATYSVYTNQTRDQKIISEKIAALKAIVDDDNSTGGTQEFYNEKYSAAVDTIRTLIDEYNDAYSSDYSESDLSGFEAIENADTYATETAKDALDIAAAGTSGLKTGDDLAEQDEALDTALLAYEDLDSSTTAYLADEYKALNDMRKASAIARLNELKCTASAGEELSATEQAINAQIEKDIAQIQALDSTQAITTTITGILESMTNKQAAALALEADKTVNGAARSDGVQANIDKQIAAVLALENTTGEDPLAAEIAVITDGGAYVCEKIEELEKEQATLTGSVSALTEGQKDTIDSLVATAIDEFNNIPYTDITTDCGKESTYLTDLADEIFDPLDTKLDAVDALNTEKKTEQAGDNSSNVIAEIDEAIDKILALTTDGDDLDEDISAITAAEAALVENIRDLETVQKAVESAISGGKFNGSQLLDEEEVEKLSKYNRGMH